MAKKGTTNKVRMVNKETGYFYIMHRNKTNTLEKLAFKKYDPRIRKHVMFKEEKMK